MSPTISPTISPIVSPTTSPTVSPTPSATVSTPGSIAMPRVQKAASAFQGNEDSGTSLTAVEVLRKVCGTAHGLGRSDSNPPPKDRYTHAVAPVTTVAFVGSSPRLTSALANLTAARCQDQSPLCALLTSRLSPLVNAGSGDLGSLIRCGNFDILLGHFPHVFE